MNLYNELIEAFHLTWDLFPGVARLINEKNETLAVNKKAEMQGFESGQICAKMGAPEIHRGCLKAASLKEMQGKCDAPNGAKVRGWVPVEGYDGIVVHFSLPIPKDK